MYIWVMYSKNLLTGTLQPIILKLLEQHDRMYGYEITQKVKELSKGKIEITEGALYPALHKLEADGILKTEREFIGKRVRKYYYLSNSGIGLASSRIAELKDFMQTLNAILSPKTTSL
jgi:PadR family transcriptional regulator PadR